MKLIPKIGDRVMSNHERAQVFPFRPAKNYRKATMVGLSKDGKVAYIIYDGTRTQTEIGLSFINKLIRINQYQWPI